MSKSYYKTLKLEKSSWASEPMSKIKTENLSFIFIQHSIEISYSIASTLLD